MGFAACATPAGTSTAITSSTTAEPRMGGATSQSVSRVSQRQGARGRRTGRRASVPSTRTVQAPTSMSAIPRIGRLEPIADVFDASALVENLDTRSRQLMNRAGHARRGWLVRRGLAAADLIGLSIAFTVATVLYGSHAGHETFGVDGEIVLFLATLPVWLVAALMNKLYERVEFLADNATSRVPGGVFPPRTMWAP